jgi:DNA-3-methyladenine glycosylase I
MSRSPRLHPDGKTRCPWPGEDALYVAYHDTEWGVPEYDDRALYEKIARYDAKKIHALMNDVGIVRNRAKIEGTIESAKSYLKIMDGGEGFAKLLWGFVDGRPKVNHFKTTARVPASTPLSIKISKDLSQRGFKFVGPTIVYAFMQATGMVNDHLVGCFCHETCGAKRRTPRLKAK